LESILGPLKVKNRQRNTFLMAQWKVFFNFETNEGLFTDILMPTVPFSCRSIWTPVPPRRSSLQFCRKPSTSSYLPLAPSTQALGRIHSKEPISKIRNKYSQKKELRGHSPNFHIHVSVSDLYIPTIDMPVLLQEICGLILGINKSVTDTTMWKLGLRPRNSQKRIT
jgi:hypothetical protein